MGQPTSSSPSGFWLRLVLDPVLNAVLAAPTFLAMVVRTSEAAGFRWPDLCFMMTPCLKRVRPVERRELVEGLQIIGFSFVRLRLDQEAGAVPNDHPLQMWRQLLSLQRRRETEIAIATFLNFFWDSFQTLCEDLYRHCFI